MTKKLGTSPFLFFTFLLFIFGAIASDDEGLSILPTHCLSEALYGLSSKLNTQIRLPWLNITSFTLNSQTPSDSIAVVQVGELPAVYSVNQKSNGCNAGLGVGLRRESTKPRFFLFHFGQTLVRRITMRVFVGDDNPQQDAAIVVQLIGYNNGKVTVTSEATTIDLKRDTNACEKSRLLELVSLTGFNEVRFVSARKVSGKIVPSSVPLALANICFHSDDDDDSDSDNTVAPTEHSSQIPTQSVSVPTQGATTSPPSSSTKLPISRPNGNTGSTCVDEGLKGGSIVLGHSIPSKPIFKHVVIKALGTEGVELKVGMKGREPSLYKINGVLNECMNGVGAGLPNGTSVDLSGFNISTNTQDLFSFFSFQLLNFEQGAYTANVRAYLRGTLIAQQDFQVKSEVDLDSNDVCLQATTWVSIGHGAGFDSILVLFQQVSGGNYVNSRQQVTKRMVYVASMCYDLYD